MKILFTFLIILVAAAFLGIIAYQDNGYVLIGRGHTTIEMSLALFLIIQISLYLVIAVGFNIIKRTWALPDFIKQHHNDSKAKHALKTSRQGLIALAQGQWKKAEKALLKNVNNSETPLLNYLSAARAAQKLNEPERRDHYLSMAHQSMPDADFAVELTQAELQLAHGQLEQSLATLVHLKSISPKHTHVLHLLAQLYEKLSSWKELQTLLPELKKYKVTSQDEYYRIQKIVFCSLLKDATKISDSADHLASIWNTLPKELKKDTDLILKYADQLISFNENEMVEPLLRAAIKNQWDTKFVYLYGLVRTSQLQQQLDFAESQIKHHEQNPILLLTLGRICIALELWGKAQSYLEASLGAKPMAETYKELALLMEQLGEHEHASQYSCKGLLLASNNFSYKNLPSTKS